MTAETWQPGDTLPSILGVFHHDLIELYDDHPFHCFACFRKTDSHQELYWERENMLGSHDDTSPPLPWLHGRAACTCTYEIFKGRRELFSDDCPAHPVEISPDALDAA